jgi:hypothetical protein
MSTFYERQETEHQIELEFKFLPLANLLFFGMIAASLSPCGWGANRTVRICGVLLLAWMAGLLPAWMELEKAMRNGSVTVSGSKFSFSHPLKVVIAKK